MCPHRGPSIKNQKSISRREMLKLTGGALLGAALSGCGGSGDRNTVTFLTPMGGPKNQAIGRLAAEWSEGHPAIRVEHMPVPWDQAHTKLLTMIAGGNPPDLFVLTGQWVSEFRAMGAIENLTPWYQGWDHKDTFTPIARQRCEIATAIDADDIYGLPVEVTVRAMFYQKQWLDDFGLQPAMTRDEWRTLLEKITAPQKQRYGYAFRGGRGGFWSWWAIAEEFAGTNEWFDGDHRCIINSPDHVAGLEYWNALYQDRLTPEDALNWGYTDLVQAFWSGVCGCCEQDNEVVGTCIEHGMDDTTLATALMPAGPKARVTSNDIWIICMSSAARNKDAAWALLTWMLTPERIIPYCKEVGVIPAARQGLDDPAFNQGFYKPFMEMVSDPTMLQNWYPSYLPEMGEFIEVLVTEEQQKMLLGQQTSQETLDRLADFMTKAQKKYVDKHGPDTPRPPKPA